MTEMKHPFTEQDILILAVSASQREHAYTRLMNDQHIEALCERIGELVAETHMHKNSLDKFQEKTSLWAAKTFPTATTGSQLAHMEDELNEIRDDPADPVEWADAFLLFMGAANSAGHSMSSIITAAETKHKINTARKWGKPNAQGYVEHIKEAVELESQHQ